MKTTHYFFIVAIGLFAIAGNVYPEVKNLKAIQEKIDEHADINELLCNAVSNNDAEAVKFLLQKGANANTTMKLSFRTNETGTTLHYALLHCGIDIIKMLLENGADVNAEINEHEKTGVTPLMIAVDHGNIELIKLLLEKGAIVPNNYEKSPISLAILNVANLRSSFLGKKNSHEIAKLLLQKMEQPPIESQKSDLSKQYELVTFMIALVYIKDIELIKLLVEKGVNVNGKLESGETPLHTAAGAVNAQFVKFLLERGADARAKDNNGCTPRDHANKQDMIWHDPEVFRLLEQAEKAAA